MKYKGVDDCLNLQIFYDLCSESGILQQFYRAAFPILLTSKALTYYYYSALAGKNLDFDTKSKRCLVNMKRNSSNKKISLNEYYLDSIYQTQKAFILEYSFACYNPVPTLEGFYAQLQSPIVTAPESSQYIGDQNFEQFFTDRRYHGGREFHRLAQQFRSQKRSLNEFRKRI
ncbi:hypothetical protein HI914_02218 [Erysiphe necator]|nr:hypothetical protein HI914_02218 [Erysiphe necator]